MLIAWSWRGTPLAIIDRFKRACVSGQSDERLLRDGEIRLYVDRHQRQGHARLNEPFTRDCFSIKPGYKGFKPSVVNGQGKKVKASFTLRRFKANVRSGLEGGFGTLLRPFRARGKSVS